ncbi:MAG: ABC transporter substrate-binding protein [Bacillota bacterium]|nr:ABC transporter substrate-binding protein [Bacillota bacterium]
MIKKMTVGLLVLLMVTALFAVAGCGGDTTTPPTEEPGENGEDLPVIKIGFLAPLTGTFAASGVDMRDGMLLYLFEKDSVLAGYKIEVVVEDTAGNPDVALTKARRLVEQENVDFLMGGLLASEGYALYEYAKDMEITYLAPIPSSETLTKGDVSDYFLRTGWSSAQPMMPLGEWMYENGYRKVVYIAMDYAFGYETAGGFQRAFENAGGEVVKKIWTPIGVPDFGPYLAEIAGMAGEIDAVVATIVGGDATRFIPAYAEYGLKDLLPLFGPGNLTDQSTMQTMGDECLGIITALHYTDGIDTPENKAYDQAFRNRYGRMNGYFNEGPYTGMMAFEATLEMVGENYNDPIAFAEAFRQIELIAPRGPMSIDDYNHPVYKVYISEVKRIDGILRNIPFDEIENVTQWGPYTPEEYMALPLYERD